MSNTVTITGNLAADPELKFTQSGHAVANITIADTPRILNKATNEWSDGETLWMRGSVWRDLAEGCAESLRRGDRVTATGELKQRNFETKEGEKRTVIEMDIREIGKSAKPRKGKGGGGAAAPAAGGDPWGGGSDDEPPF